MLRKHFRLLSNVHHLLDFFLLALAIWWAHSWTSIYPALGETPAWVAPELGASSLLLQVGLVLAFWALVSRRRLLYDSHRTEGRFSILLRVVETVFQAVGFGALVSLLISGALTFHPLLALALALLLILGSRVVLLETLSRVRAQGFNFRRVLFAGRGIGARRFHEELIRNPHYGLQVIGALSFASEQEKTDQQLASSGGVTRMQFEDLGAIGRFQAVVAEHDVDQVLIFPSGETRDEEIAQLCRDCDAVGISYVYTPGYAAENSREASPVWYGGLPGLSFKPANQPTFRLAIKRAIDVAVGGLGLLLISPLVLVLGLLIKLTDGGPVFFKQVRVGKGGSRFNCYKFRSMRNDAEETKELLLDRNEADGPVFKIRKDPRVTRVGRFMRKYSLDELPQLWSVFRGDMSLVGPRPPVPSEVRNYEWWQRRRLAVKPGLTCIWQVWGRNQTTFKRWVEMDIQYIDGWSLWLDVKLIAHTFGVVVKGTGM